VVKLFARVVTAEETTQAPYIHGRIDMEALICSLEDALVASKDLDETYQLDKLDVCEEMVASLLRSILSVHGDARSLRFQMEELGIDPQASSLGNVLLKCIEEAKLSDMPRPNEVDSDKGVATVLPVETLINVQPKTPSKDVATLVSRLGRAPPGEERESALESIRAYKSAYGGDELDAHLQQLSGAFREFIVEQINRDPSPQKQMLPIDNTGSSVSERIRNLRSRLQASEMNGPKDIKYEGMESHGTFREPTTVAPGSLQSENLTSFQNAATPSKIPKLSGNKPTTAPFVESKLPVPGRLLSTSAVTNISTAQTLRERLAARQVVSQQQSDDATNNNSSFGRAAALRARLEVVKQQSKQMP
jgi:hypothetical protein